MPLSLSLSLSFTSSVLPTHHLHFRHPSLPLKPPTHFHVSALILPPSSRSSYRNKQTHRELQQDLYQPYRPPPSPLPAKYRSLDTNARLDILSNRMGLWFEYAPIITSLIQEGFISTTLEEITGIASVEQNSLVVAAQVRDSLLESTDADTVSYFDSPSSPDILYEIRILNTPQRALAAQFIIKYGFDRKKAEELARSVKDYPRRYGERGWESFDGNLPGDCLAFMYFRQAQEHKNASSPELSRAMLEKALEFAETDRAKERVTRDMEGKEKEGGSVDIEDLVRVPVVRMGFGEVAESSTVVVFPVCSAEEVEMAPWECEMGGQFGVVKAEKGWRRWVVLPGWGPVSGLKRGGVAVLFPRAGGVLPWRINKKDAEEEIVVVVDRGLKEVESEEGGHYYYLVESGSGSNGRQGLQVERGVIVNLKSKEEVNIMGRVMLVVKPPREDTSDQILPEEWD